MRFNVFFALCSYAHFQVYLLMITRLKLTYDLY